MRLAYFGASSESPFTVDVGPTMSKKTQLIFHSFAQYVPFSKGHILNFSLSL